MDCAAFLCCRLTALEALPRQFAKFGHCGTLCNCGPGVGQRIQTGIQALYKAKFPNEPMVPTKVVENTERMYATWLGGSMLGVLPMFHKMWISRADYNEHGPGVVHTKCF
eukprot:EG_transcript_35411